MVLKAAVWLVCATLAAAMTARALAESATPASPPLSFEVASIKPGGPSDLAKLRFTVDNDRFEIGIVSVHRLIQLAYGVEENQIAGGPDWLHDGHGAELFTVSAKMPEATKPGQWREMLQNLLAERFNLAVHREKRDNQVYALVVGKGGARIKQADPNIGGKVVTNSTMSTGADPVMRIEADMPMDFLAMRLTDLVDRPVVNMTGLTGKYKVVLEVGGAALVNYARKRGMPLATSSSGAALSSGLAMESPGDSVFTAVEQLGLKLERRTMPFEFLMIDRIERTPTEN